MGYQKNKELHIHKLRHRLRNLQKYINQKIVGHRDMIDALLLGIIAREHVVLIGPPGIAKTYLVKTIAKLLGARVYTYLLNRFTDFAELFGPIDIKSLAEKSELVRRWSNIVSSEIVFLDEIFKANTAILNTLLSLMQERIVYDPMTGKEIETKLWTLIGASNETPTEEELLALYDRFAIRVFEDYLGDNQKIYSALASTWGENIKETEIATMQDIQTLHNISMKLLSEGTSLLPIPFYKLYYVVFVNIITGLRNEGITLSDRTIIEKLPKLYAAHIIMNGITPTNILVKAPLKILPLIAQNAEQQKEIKSILSDIMAREINASKHIDKAIYYLEKEHDYKNAKKELLEARKILEKSAAKSSTLLLHYVNKLIDNVSAIKEEELLQFINEG